MDQSNPEERGAQVRFPPPLVFLIGIGLGFACEYFLAHVPIPVAKIARIIAAIGILLAGVGLVAWARILFSRTGQSPIPWKSTPALIIEGPFHFTRNPMYVGLTLCQVGLGLAENNLWIVLFAFPALLVVHFVAVVPEERYLDGKFGDSYQAYRARVRRYI